MARRTPPAPPPTSHAEMMRLVDALPLPPKPAEQQTSSGRYLQRLEGLTAELRTRNLANGLALAQQAAQRQGPLVNVFTEIGRRYGHLLNQAEVPTTTRTNVVDAFEHVVAETCRPKPQRMVFRVIEGGLG